MGVREGEREAQREGNAWEQESEGQRGNVRE